MVLGRRLGEFLGAVNAANPAKISVEFGGDAANLLTKPIVNAVVTGVLGRLLGDEVNEVSAPMVAKDRGIEVREQKTTQRSAFSTLLRVVVTGADGKTSEASGTLGSDASPRLVSWGGFDLDSPLQGALLILKNKNKPGVIGTVGTTLADSGINVARMQVALEAKSDLAVQVWGLDSVITEQVLILVRAAKDVEEAVGVQLT